MNYNWFYNTPVLFSGVSVLGTPVNPTLPAIGPNSTLVVTGSLTFVVDPASINVETVPEPGLAGAGGRGTGSLAAVWRRRK